MNIVHIPTKDIKRLNDKFDPRIREYLEWLSENWEQHFTKEQELPTSSLFSVVFNLKLTRLVFDVEKDGNITAGRMISGQTRGNR